MMLIDHIFIRARTGAPEADALRKFGLTEGSSNKHPGQGTENRRFFFRNAFIELIWLADRDEIQSAETQPTMLFERLSEEMGETSPFGVCFRPGINDPFRPFPSWSYTPAYLPTGLKVEIGQNVPLSEPMWFFLSKGVPPDALPTERRQPLEHQAGIVEITSIALTMPKAGKLSTPAVAANNSRQVSFLEGNEHLLEVIFDHGAKGRVQDFRPVLPLVFRY